MSMHNEARNLIYPLLRKHFDGHDVEDLTITERRFPGRVRADVQRAIDGLTAAIPPTFFCGLRKRYTMELTQFTELLVHDRSDPVVAVPPLYEEIDIGEDAPVRCLKSGLWLLETERVRLAVLLQWQNDESGFQVATVNDEPGLRVSSRVFQRLDEAVRRGSCYRGKVLSLETSTTDYFGRTIGLRVHRLPRVAREQIILPARTLELLERNVLRFVEHREELTRRGLAAKKGLLFYGPPGTGKTHTIHYLSGALPGMTTFVVTAEHVQWLTDYMMLARMLQPSLVVIEDADLIARERERMGSPIEEVLLNKLLNEMDGLREDAEILFVLTTNRAEALEAALASRPGRIDQAIEFPLPDEEGRQKLVRLYAHGSGMSHELVAHVARRCEQVSPAFIKELLRRAAQFQLERDAPDVVRAVDIDAALDEMLVHGGSLNRKLLGTQLE
jgi:hypothetical protein